MISKLRILCVEDDNSLLGALRMFLGVYNDFVGVSRLTEARQFLQMPHTHYDVVILDKTLPDGLGFDLIPDIRQHSNRAAVIILTGDQDLTSVTRCLDAGADDYAIKTGTLIPELMIRIPVALKSAIIRDRLQNGGALSSSVLPQSSKDITFENYKKYTNQAERDYLNRSLELLNWDYHAALQSLGLARSTLFKKISELNIPRPKLQKTQPRTFYRWEPRF